MLGFAALSSAPLADDSVLASASAVVTGVAATAALGVESATGAASAIVTGTGATGQVGGVSVVLITTAQSTGVAATGQVGDVAVELGAVVVPVAGVLGNMQVGRVLVWALIDPQQNAAYTDVDIAQGSSWVPVAPDQTPAWERVVA